ncbi:hypothetical protein CTAM01_08987 [Colletotrichum tamarilloi]|uniref:Uncharacterized protein n=1 Tax=Colletotrichum tamarilloi TaxID=1209934 RepID=A0ABQ9R4T1_9PEZI|nr:uncharacterized protein CTAM01_08987 [Colletotrichum tamarilloi]KAK1494633.1 hypothetical protein CTAM01_08987 [Colletotrichum tamarilloi]
MTAESSMGFFRRMFAFLEEGSHHALSKGKPSRSLMSAAIALNKMGRRPSSNSFRGENVASNSLTTTRCHAATCESSSESISNHSATATAQDESQLCVLNDAIDFEPEKQLAIRILRCRVPSTMSPRSSIESISPVKAGVKQLGELLEHESRFAKYHEEDDDCDEWGIQCGGIDEAAVSSKRHPNIVNYEKYIDNSVIQQISEDLPEAENADFKTATKSARNLRFGNYTTGKYVKIKSKQDDGVSRPQKKPGKWVAGLLRKAISLFFPKVAQPALSLAAEPRVRFCHPLGII